MIFYTGTMGCTRTTGSSRNVALSAVNIGILAVPLNKSVPIIAVHVSTPTLQHEQRL